MRHAILAVLLLAALAGTAVAGPFEDAVSAYERGDYATALRGFWMLAAQGDAGAQTVLGFMYVNGLGVPQDYAEAANCYRKAAEQGHAGGQYNLGLMYSQGKGVPQDFVQAHMWLNLAGTQGDEEAAENRKIVAEVMTPAQIAEAQRRAAEWKPNEQRSPFLAGC